MWAGKTNGLYVFSFGLFFVGAWLLTLAFTASGARRIIFRIAAALVFFLSFALNSMMVLYAFATLGLFVAVWRGNNQKQDPIRRLLASVWHCVAGYPELVLLPLLYWGAINLWFKRVGVYAEHYHTHLPAFSELLDGLRVFLLIGYRDVLKSVARTALENPSLFWLAALLIVVAFGQLRPEARRSRVPGYQMVLPLLLAPVLFVTVAAVSCRGLRPAEHFYETRHLLLRLAVGAHPARGQAPPGRHRR